LTKVHEAEVLMQLHAGVKEVRPASRTNRPMIRRQTPLQKGVTMRKQPAQQEIRGYS
jgi:hypothetical protein